MEQALRETVPASSAAAASDSARLITRSNENTVPVTLLLKVKAITARLTKSRKNKPAGDILFSR